MRKTLPLITLLIAFVCNLNAQETNKAVQKLKAESNAFMTLNKSHNIADFVRFPVDKPMRLEGTTLEQKSISFLEKNKAIYKLESIENSLRLDKVFTDNYGLKHVFYKQVHEGVPVFDAQMRFHFNTQNELTSINGDFIPAIKLNATPSISQLDANVIALRLVEEQDLNYSGATLIINKSTLYVFQKGLIQDMAGANYLVYEVEVRNDNDVREFIYVNAHNGEIVEQFTGMAHALDRRLYEGNTSTLIWTEGSPFPGTLDQWQQNEVAAAGHTYNFFKNAFGYVSYDGADAQMRTVNNDPGISCPNANWNGSTANYCTGTASDDIVGHEWGHAYTEYTSGLIYAYQSGAMNESYSDIWGETIDMINNYEDAGENLSARTSCSNSVRWKMGEDASAFGGAIRDLWNPNCNGDPGRVGAGNYWCSAADSGGVHINSGIPNHCYALIVDGGTYNGQTISGIGFTKAAHIFWRAQSVYLTATSNFHAMADALDAACADLVGMNLEGLSTTGTAAGPSGEIITAADCAELTKAILAVELRTDNSCGFTPLLVPTAPLCGAATTNPMFFEDWESGLGSWSVRQFPSNPGTWEPREWTVVGSLPDGRAGQGVFGPDPINGDCAADLENGTISLTSPIITIPNVTTGTFELSFNHNISTEPEWDGGNIRYKLGTGAWTNLPGSAFTTNGYNGTLQTAGAGNDNPLSGQDAFTGSDEGSSSGSWGQSTIDLSSLGVVANSTIQFRWLVGTDGCNGRVGWYIDEVVIYNCSAALAVGEYEYLLEGISIFPNPSKGKVTLKKTMELDLQKAEIYDINGRVLKTIDLKDVQIQKEINIDSFSPGLYFITITTNDAKGVFKLIKE